MSTTSVRIPGELKSRLAKAAERGGVTPHAFIVGAIERCTEEAEADAALQRAATRRLRRFEATGEAIPWTEAREYLEALARGESPPRPKPRRVIAPGKV